MGRKSFAGAAPATTLTAQLATGVTTTFTVTDATGFPVGSASAPFVVVLDRGTALEEKVLCYRSGNTFTIASGGRAYDSTTQSTHEIGGSVRHVIDSITIDEANAHVNDTTRDDHTQYLNTTRHDTTTRHSIGTVVPSASPSFALGTAASAGSANSVVRSDATIAIFDGTVPSALGSAAVGSIAFAARRDHVHPTTGLALTGSANSFTGNQTTTGYFGGASGGSGEAFRIGDDAKIVDINVANTLGVQGLADSTTGGIQFGSSGPTLSKNSSTLLQIGSNIVVTRGDVATTVTTGAVGDAGTVGTSTNYAREDHKHGREAFAAVSTQLTYGLSGGNGSAVTLARSDHTHGTVSLTSTAPLALGAAAVGTGTDPARNDHVHPTTGLGVLSASNTWAASNAFSSGLSTTTISASSFISATEIRYQGNTFSTSGADATNAWPWIGYNLRGSGATVTRDSAGTASGIRASGSQLLVYAAASGSAASTLTSVATFADTGLTITGFLSATSGTFSSTLSTGNITVTTTGGSLQLKSPNGTTWTITVDNNGSLTTT